MITSTTYLPGGSIGVPARYGSKPLRSSPEGFVAVVGLATQTVQLVPGMEERVTPLPELVGHGVPGALPTHPVVLTSFPVVASLPSELGKKYLPSYGAG